MKVEDFEDIVYKKEDNGICTITINRPERRNAVTPVSFLEIMTALDDMENDKKARVLIITGAPEANAFSSGGYYANFAKLSPEIKEQIDLMDMAQKRVCLKFWDFSKPVIAAINGLAIGAGITMPLAGADLIYMSTEAWLGFYFVKRAIVPEFAASFLLPFYLGFQKAKEILYFGDKIDANKAKELGLVNDVLPPDQLIPHVRKVAERLIPPKAPSVALTQMKKLMHSYFRDILSETLDNENQGIQNTFTTSDFRKATVALKTKKDPKFRGK